MDSGLEVTVNCIKFVCTLDAAKKNEELHNSPPELQAEAYIGLSID